MNALIFYVHNEFADAGQQPFSQAVHQLRRCLSNPGRVGFARCWPKGLFRR